MSQWRAEKAVYSSEASCRRYADVEPTGLNVLGRTYTENPREEKSESLASFIAQGRRYENRETEDWERTSRRASQLTRDEGSARPGTHCVRGHTAVAPAPLWWSSFGRGVCLYIGARLVSWRTLTARGLLCSRVAA
ncbi:hypothetical protein E2C01_063137 [Portunus trituberculatus]|uniref:Uncharacterized protein n=1 Tax=Portunus trituberculatus TaxID=210409 RepID=A0A5B7HHA8_PORTR|nr:hypothetical protein [Portunus trituberculatus]